jgi:DNA-directed RNA polymerase specialized sigma24 family protein
MPQPAIDQRSIEALIVRDYAGLRQLLVRRARDPALAADLLNDAICTTLEKWRAGQIARPEQICGYVFQVALNLLRNHRRSIAERPERRADIEMLERTPTNVVSIDESVEAGMAQRVRGLLQHLGNARDRLILKRFDLDEERKDVICGELGLAADQFDRVLHRARARLRDLLESSGLRRTDLFSLVMA